MRLSTRIALAKVTFRHQILKMRVHNPVLLKTIQTFAVMAILGLPITGFLVFGLGNNNPPRIQAEQTELEIKTYSVNGQVTAISTNTITVRLNLIQTDGKQNMVVHEERSVLISENTNILKVVINGGKVALTEGVSTDIVVGKTVAIYSSSNPAINQILNADRIELIEQK